MAIEILCARVQTSWGKSAAVRVIWCSLAAVIPDRVKVKSLTSRIDGSKSTPEFRIMYVTRSLIACIQRRRKLKDTDGLCMQVRLNNNGDLASKPKFSRFLGVDAGRGQHPVHLGDIYTRVSDQPTSIAFSFRGNHTNVSECNLIQRGVVSGSDSKAGGCRNSRSSPLTRVNPCLIKYLDFYSCENNCCKLRRRLI